MTPFLMDVSESEQRELTPEEHDLVAGGQCAERCQVYTEVGDVIVMPTVGQGVAGGDVVFDGMTCDVAYG
ncbi:MAG: hypothetical protein ACT6R7_16585 [Brevundimonas aurantiaca]|jgi:hypothetical protein|uniref:hypothetical protein n=1 Tax=Brevundimonas aurantiaca TaxID=74316 RepID=UPI0040348FCF